MGYSMFGLGVTLPYEISGGGRGKQGGFVYTAIATRPRVVLEKIYVTRKRKLLVVLLDF